MWPVKVLLLLLCCSGYWCNNCNKTRLYFESRNFYSVLHWDAVDIPGQEVLYSVVYSQYGKPFKAMMDCQNISVTSCDLSSVINETSHSYSTKILVNQTCLGEYERFKLSEQTTLGAPELSISLTEHSLTVTVMPPLGPHNRSIMEIIRSASGIFHINYEVQLTTPKPKTAQNTSGVVTLNSLEENTEYCGTAFYLWTHPSILKKSEITPFCVTLPGKSWMHVFIIPGVVALVFLIILGLVLCQLYVMRKRRLPDVLKQSMAKSNILPYFLDPKVEISNVRIYSEFPWKSDRPCAEVHPAVEINRTEGFREQYAPQDLPWQCVTYANQQVAQVENYHQSNNTVTSYSMVITDPVPGSPISSDSGVEGSISSQVTTPSLAGQDTDHFQEVNNNNTDSEESTHELDEKESDTSGQALVLLVSRGANGKLEFQPEILRPPSGLLSLSSGVTPAGERTPLLGDVITFDETEQFSGDYGKTCLRRYVQQDPTSPSTEAVPLVSLLECTSSYKQNWMPGKLSESQINDADFTVKTEPETEEEEALSRMEAMFLDGCIGGLQLRIS